MSRYTDESELTQEELIYFLKSGILKDGIKYIYNPDGPKMYKHYSNEYWVESNTAHMEFILNMYNNKLKGRNHSIIIQINSLIKYVSSDYKSIINYFRETAEEYKNDKHKIICIIYNFGQYVLDGY